MCGAKYIEGKTQPWECSECGNLRFDNSVPCAEIALFSEDGKILLAKRGREPNKGKYDLPGGFVIFAESMEDALIREIDEELSLKPSDYEKPLYCTSWTHDYPFSNEVLNTLTMTFTAKLKTKKRIIADDDVVEVIFVDMSELDSYEYSCSDYPEIIRKAYSLIFN